MSIIIQYLKQFNKEYKDFIIVLSKFGELKNIKNLPFEANSLFQSKELKKTLEDNHYYETFVKSNNSKSFHNIKLILIQNLKNDQYILEGAKLFSKFNKKSNKELNIVFTSRLIKKYNNLCSNFLFGFLLKSYSFSKYKKNNRFTAKGINIFNSKKVKLKNFKSLNNLLTSINFSKDLVSEPANILNPVTYAEKCLELKKIGLKVKVLDKNQIEKIGMNSLLRSFSRKYK